MNNERAYWLAWSQISHIGPVLLKRIADHFGTLEGAWQADGHSLAQVDGLGRSLIEAIIANRNKIKPLDLLPEHLEKNPNFWTPADPHYPKLLLEIASPPPVLYYSGQVVEEENAGIVPCITLVGTRKSTIHGRKWAKKISENLVEYGFTVVSSMANGIDSEAQNHVLEIGGRTIGILATGIDLNNSHQLYQKVNKSGLLLSEYPQGTRAQKGNYVARNRLLAGLSRAVIVIEAPEISGTLSTARYGNEFGRDVYVLPNSPDIQQALGCLKLIREGAEVITSIEELLSGLGGLPALKEKTTSSSELPNISGELLQIWQTISGEILSFDQIVIGSQMPSSQVSGLLLELELLGLVTQLPGMRYQRL